MQSAPETRTAGAEAEPAGPEQPAEREPEWEPEYEGQVLGDGELPNFR